MLAAIIQNVSTGLLRKPSSSLLPRATRCAPSRCSASIIARDLAVVRLPRVDERVAPDAGHEHREQRRGPPARAPGRALFARRRTYLRTGSAVCGRDAAERHDHHAEQALACGAVQSVLTRSRVASTTNTIGTTGKPGHAERALASGSRRRSSSTRAGVERVEQPRREHDGVGQLVEPSPTARARTNRALHDHARSPARARPSRAARAAAARGRRARRAYGTRAPVSIEPFIADSAEIAIATASSACAVSPRNCVATFARDRRRLGVRVRIRRRRSRRAAARGSSRC